MSTAVAPAREFDVALPDGRTLHGYDAGELAGEVVIVHHGTPCSGVLAASWAQDAADRGIRLVGFSRPGYAPSDRHPGRSVADVAADTAAVADAVGADRFRCWGISGGGPHALACAALLPDRVVAAACLAGPAPYDAAGLDWMGGMGESNVAEFGAAVAGGDQLAAFLSAERDGMLATTPDTLAAAMSTLLPPADLAVFDGESAEFLHAWLTTGLRDGYHGWYDDDLAFVRDWGFALADITVPVLVVHGEQDLMVPFAHGRWLTDQLPGAESMLSANDGHLTLLSDIGRVHDWLLAHGGGAILEPR